MAYKLLSEHQLRRYDILSSLARQMRDMSNLASIYTDAGLFDKAKSSLSLSMKRTARTQEMYHFLIRLYGSSDSIFRIWNSLNRTHPGFNNMSYLVLLQALDKLGDLEGLRASFREWLDCNSLYDVRLAHVLVGALLRYDLYDEALTAFEDAAKRMRGPFLKMKEIWS